MEICRTCLLEQKLVLRLLPSRWTSFSRSSDVDGFTQGMFYPSEIFMVEVELTLFAALFICHRHGLRGLLWNLLHSTHATFAVHHSACHMATRSSLSAWVPLLGRVVLLYRGLSRFVIFFICKEDQLLWLTKHFVVWLITGNRTACGRSCAWHLCLSAWR